MHFEEYYGHPSLRYRLAIFKTSPTKRELQASGAWTHRNFFATANSTPLDKRDGIKPPGPIFRLVLKI